ncbi:MAG TPA: PQQ-dependent sugar dehydrogenase [Myxococcales bacterium]|nr:PQQ-dependent sugar dehydrogenase [Myxococcales bacterium]
MRSPARACCLIAVLAACSRESNRTGPPGSVALQDAFSGLRFQAPLQVAQVPGESRFVVVEKRGTVQAVSGQTEATFLDIRSRVNSTPGEAGLLGLAFHPRWAQNRQVFVNYTAPSAASPANLRTTISRFTSADGGATLDPASEQVLLTVEQPFENHNGGSVVFGPDGLLYLGLGDGGSGGDPLGNAQNVSVILGKLLRIDVDSGAPYGIPPSNPFAAGGGRPEVYAYGLRNPWRFSFDRATGALWVGDVGQGDWEEVDVVEAGANYGWNRREGRHCYPPGSSSCAGAFRDPVVEYSHAEGASITGGYVYRGAALPQLAGHYVYGDFGSGRIWAVPAGGPYTPVQVGQGNAISSFGEDAQGELYVVDLVGGQVSKLVAAP